MLYRYAICKCNRSLHLILQFWYDIHDIHAISGKVQALRTYAVLLDLDNICKNLNSSIVSLSISISVSDSLCSMSLL